MAETRALAAAGDTLTVKLPRDMSNKARFGIQSLGAAVGFVGILEASMDNQGTWEPLLATPAAGGAATSALSTVGSSVADVSGYTDVRIRATALTSGGPVQVRINTSEGV